MAITDKELAAANARGREMLRTTPHAVAARYDGTRNRIVIELSTGIELAFPPGSAQGLETASPADLAKIEIDPPGFGLHFPRLDADLYVPALLEGALGSQAWAAARMGQEGGKAKHTRQAGGLARQWSARRPAAESLGAATLHHRGGHDQLPCPRRRARRQTSPPRPAPGYNPAKAVLARAVLAAEHPLPGQPQPGFA